MRLLKSCIVSIACCVAAASAADLAAPVVKDPRLQLTLVAENPQIVTPIGCAVDAKGRLFVIESHTHHRKPEYDGPPSDRVKVFDFSSSDPKPQVSIFADGFRFAMNLVFSPQGVLHLVHRNGVVRLEDKDGDGVCDAQVPLLTVETKGDYPHNALSGVAFSRDGWLYVGIGENLGLTYTVHGTDGSHYTNPGGDGGHIFRCRPDGSQLRRFATGVWNPFGLAFDRAGNLFCVDNDPDSRPPCRLLHIVDGGDYGFQFRLGRHGMHPFEAWNGELPGTLPMVAGTGEAPSGILLADHAALPPSYRGAFITGSWGDHFIEVYRPKPAGASFRAQREVLIEGGEFFRPVSITAAPDGTIYFTDWMDKSYPVHGKGRIWRLTTKPGVAVMRPADANVPLEPNTAIKRMQELLAADSPKQTASLLAALADADPFIRSAAINTLARPVFRAAVLDALDNKDPQVRVGATLALRRGKFEQPETILKKLLSDADEKVRFVALKWIGERNIASLGNDMDAACSIGSFSPEVFRAYLAAAELLASPTNIPTGKVPPRLIDQLLHDDSKPAALRAMAIALVPDTKNRRTVDCLTNFVRGPEPLLRREAIRTLAMATNASVAPLFQQVALDAKNSVALRADAIAALARQSGRELPALVPLLDDPSSAVQIETARALRTIADNAAVRAALAKKCASLDGKSATSAFADELRFALGQPQPHRPANRDAWPAVLLQGGDAESGRRVFFHPQVGCAKCHQVQGRGGRVGPDLSTIARSSDRQKLIQSVLNPSKEIAPQFEQHMIETKDDQTYAGIWLNAYIDGGFLLSVPGLGEVKINGADIASHRTSQLSLMPEGLENAMTVQDFRDILAFLLSNR